MSDRKEGMTVPINILAEPNYTEANEAIKRLGERTRKRLEQAVLDVFMGEQTSKEND
jgi:hypothetical protein